jgi:phosphoglycolate phosphatase
MTQNLLFDLDGTLTDPYVGITASIRAALACLGRPAPPPERLGWCIGPPLRESFKRLLVTEDDALADRALTHYRERFGAVGLFENRVYAGVPTVLEQLSAKGYRLFVATSKPGVFADRILDHFGLRVHFSAVYGSELDGTRNDKGDLIAHLLSREAIPAAETVMIGDRYHDIVGARRNGVGAYGVLWGYGTRMELEKAGAVACLESPADLTARFQ